MGPSIRSHRLKIEIFFDISIDLELTLHVLQNIQ